MLSGVAFLAFRFGETEENDDTVFALPDSVQKEKVEEDPPISISKREPRFPTSILEMSENEFRSNLGMSKSCFLQLLVEIAPLMKKATRSTLVPPIVKLGTFLHCLVVGSGQREAVRSPHLPKMSQSGVSTIMNECLDIFEEQLCPKWIRFEMSEGEEDAIKDEFFANFGIPGTVGCVGSTHIKLRAPADVRYLYSNVKGYFSINAMMICDANLVIRYVDARAPGSNTNADVWKASLADEYLMSAYKAGKRNTWVLGDSGYPLLPYLMTPYRQPKYSNEVAYNMKLHKALEVIERTLKTLRNRFRCLLGDKELNYYPGSVTKIVNTCCALHNFCIFNKDQWEITDEVEVPEIRYTHEEDMSSIEASEIRDQLTEIIK